MQPAKPEGYSANGGEALLSSYEAAYDSSGDALGLARGAAEAQFAQERPSVVAVMNETFSDLSIFDGMHAGYTGPEYFNSMADCARRVYQTDYVVWANYDIAGCDQVSEVDDVSASFLASEVAQLIGAPLTSFQKAHIELRRALPEISAACYEDAAGGWFLPNVDCGIDATDQARADFATMQFYDLFRDGQGIYSSQLQDEPNVDPVAR